MSKFQRCALAVLTSIVFTSSAILHAQGAPASGLFRDNPTWADAGGVLTASAPTPMGNALNTRRALADSVTSFEFRAPPGAKAVLFMQGRYGFELAGTGEWQQVLLRFRAPRFDAGYNKEANALALEERVGKETRRNVVFEKSSPGARWAAEDMRGPAIFVVVQGSLSLRNVRHDPADFAQVTVPAAPGGDTNEKALVDFVALGREKFEQLGCVACHLVEPSETAVSSGPNLFGLLRPEARSREVVEGGEGHRFAVKANRQYLQRSLREPAEQLAVAESGPTRGQAYLPVMPVFGAETLSDQDIDAIGDYLATLNEPQQRGPVERLAAKVAVPPYDPMTDGLQWLVSDEVRMQRGPMTGVSARSIHVGSPNGVNYSFDPRLLAIAKIWQGGFLDMSGELMNRGGRGLALGYDSREIGFGEREYLLAPLDPQGRPVDFSFKEAKFGDSDRIRAALNSTQDQFAQVAAIDAQFLGYSRNSKDKLAAPAFKYRIGRNVIEVTTVIAASGDVTITIRGNLVAPQVFTANSQLLQNAKVSAGSLQDERWTLPAGKVNARLNASMALAAKAWRPAASNYSHKVAPVSRAAATAQLPPGYSIENYYPPKDNFGRDQLFEALGLDLAKDGTVVVATRNAGIWRMVKGEWRLFAEGLFDSLGVVVEDSRGLVVVAGQKAELTRIRDTNGDGIADSYETLFDAHSYHGNYHTYLHGPVRAPDGAYYFALNLVHDGSGVAYTGGGNTMGSWGGYSGWAIRVEPNGKYQAFANGLRSPASLGVAPDGRVWYTDNQGDFVASSKMFELKKDRFYGHPAGLVDLPGMTPASPEIQYARVVERREKAAVLFPHNRVANSPGNPAWITHEKFGPFTGQLLIGDQTQSNLLRVVMQKVGNIEQGSVMPFFEGLESGVMRPLFLPDGSLLLGQTGRGWQAKGGKIASLQHVRWDGKTVAPGVLAMLATSRGFTLQLTQPVGANVSAAQLQAALSLESWVYRDAPDYGSPELDLRPEGISSIALSADRRTLEVTRTSLAQPQVHAQQTARVYRARLASSSLFDGGAAAQLDAYYTLYKFP